MEREKLIGVSNVMTQRKNDGCESWQEGSSATPRKLVFPASTMQENRGLMDLLHPQRHVDLDQGELGCWMTPVCQVDPFW